MDNKLTVQENNKGIEKIAVEGDLSGLNIEERINYYWNVCDSLGLNPLTKPFDYIKLNNKLVLYAKRDATDQLRKIHEISIAITGREKMEDVYIVTAKATDKKGRTDESTGVVPLTNLNGANLANALMKAETKAKRRVTLSIVGLGWLDETEIETIPKTETVDIEMEKEITPHQPQSPQKQNGKPYKFPSNAAEEFYRTVQEHTNSYYKNAFHLVKTLGGQWFNFADKDIYEQKLDFAVSYARDQANDI